ncbi:MAG: SCP2 sterol-binding domain-containing protein [Chloroflexota bacterium]
MSAMQNHPTVQAFYEQQTSDKPISEGNQFPLDAAWLRQLCLDAGADDVGFVALSNPSLDDQRDDLLTIFPHTQTLISLVYKMNREPVRSTVRSVANREFHTAGKHMDEVAHDIVRTLEDQGIRAVNPAMAFPMEAHHFPDKKTWLVSHKPIAEAAGLGVMGVHRNVIHPKFGNFILLGTILLEAEVSSHSTPLTYNPCLECKLCVAACPVGAIASDGHFNAAVCLTHNYREFLGGFRDWAETVADSRNKFEYQDQVTPGEDASFWQSLSYGANYKSAYCMAVCPAGEDVIGPFLADRKGFLDEMVKPLQQKEEVIYATPNSDAIAYVEKRYPHKTLKIVNNGAQVQTVAGFVNNAAHVFQRNQSDGLTATYHFTFTGEEPCEVSFIIKDKTLTIQDGHQGTADVKIRANSETWMRFLNGRTNIVWAMMRGKIRIKGPIKLLSAFGKCFG